TIDVERPAARELVASARRSTAARFAMGGMLSLLCLAATLQAQTPDAGPAATVQALLEKADLGASASKTRDEQLTAVRAAARQLVDTRAMGRTALGPSFSTYSEAQQQEFLRLFDELVVRSYLQKLLLFRQPTFRFGKSEKRGEAVIVNTDVVTGKDAYEV